MRDIVGKCLIKDASKRPSAAQLLEHKFFKVNLPSLHLTSLSKYRLIKQFDGLSVCLHLLSHDWQGLRMCVCVMSVCTAS